MVSWPDVHAHSSPSQRLANYGPWAKPLPVFVSDVFTVLSKVALVLREMEQGGGVSEQLFS